MKLADIPKFGPLQGVYVVFSGMAIAGPYAASLMADFGASVIQIENSHNPDICRTTNIGAIEQERRNEIAINLDIPSPEGRDIFLRLLKKTDIFIENAKGGQYKKWGLTDDILWAANPKLVICHVSGFGQYGDPDYVPRSSWDAIGQAFGGYMVLNGEPDGLPMPASPLIGDYMTAMHAAYACLAAYINVQRTGVGESIDCAQFEAVAKAQHGFATDVWTFGIPRTRGGSKGTTGHAGWGVYRCADGKYVYIAMNGRSAFKQGLSLLRLEYGSEAFPEGTVAVHLGTKAGDLIEEAIQRFCVEHPAAEVDMLLNRHSIPASLLVDYQTMAENPHYKARNTVVEWKNTSGKRVKGIKVVPELKNNPGQIWRGAPKFGEDTEDVLLELGCTAREIEELYQKGIISK